MPPRAQLAAATVVLAAVVAACAPSRAVRPQSPQIGRPLALAAPDLAGRELDVGAQQGTVRLVDFWASWCEPCREAMPYLDRLAAELGHRGLAVYAVSFDEDREQAAEFLRQVPVAFPVLWDKGGDRLSGPFEVSRLPTTVIADRRGVIRWVQDGWSDAKARDTRREVERLLAEPAP